MERAHVLVQHLRPQPVASSAEEVKPAESAANTAESPKATSLISSVPVQSAGEWEPNVDFGREKIPWPLRMTETKKLSERVPFSAHADWRPDPQRPDPVATILKTNVGRQEDLLPIRMGRMAASPFAFLRGADAVMAYDLSRTPSTGMHVLIDGDAHLLNYGFYGTPARQVVWDLNDFDEVTYGPWEWDLKRLAVSFNVACRENKIKKPERLAAVEMMVTGYQFNLRRLLGMGALDLWALQAFPEKLSVYADQLKTAVGHKLSPKFLAHLQETVNAALKQDNRRLLEKVAHPSVGGAWRFIEEPPVLTLVDAATKAKVVEALNKYVSTVSVDMQHMLARYTIVDVCHRIVGIGSVGVRAYLAMLFGNDKTDPLFLQLKEATPPVHAPYLPPLPPQFVAHDGWRVVHGQVTMQAANDPLLGWTEMEGRKYYVRQMRNFKASIDPAVLDAAGMKDYALLCGTLLARGHSRSGDNAKILGYIGESSAFGQAIAKFSEVYADQNALDHKALRDAISAGRVPATPGV